MTSLVTVFSMEQDGSQVRWPALLLSPHREANMTRYTATKLHKSMDPGKLAKPTVSGFWNKDLLWVRTRMSSASHTQKKCCVELPPLTLTPSKTFLLYDFREIRTHSRLSSWRTPFPLYPEKLSLLISTCDPQRSGELSHLNNLVLILAVTWLSWWQDQ